MAQVNGTALKVTNITVFKPISRYYNQGRRGKCDVTEPQLWQESVSLAAKNLSCKVVYPSGQYRNCFGAETQTT
jgi:hypothetical protein